MSALTSKRVILAAAKLAAIYIALVILGIVVLDVTLRAGVPPLDVIREFAIWLSIPFACAFVLLAVARRWGFVALWVILGALWIAIGVVARSWRWSIDFPSLFVLWTIFALPLWIIGQAGIPLPSRRRISPSMVLLACWAVLLVSSRFVLPRTDPPDLDPHSALLFALAWIWAPMPLVLSAFAISHVWRGTAKPVPA
jgi:hypothetical protein